MFVDYDRYYYYVILLCNIVSFVEFLEIIQQVFLNMVDVMTITLICSTRKPLGKQSIWKYHHQDVLYQDD